MFNCLGKFQSPGKPPAAFHKFKTSLGRGALLHTEPVSGFSAVSAVSAAPRFARNQCAGRVPGRPDQARWLYFAGTTYYLMELDGEWVIVNVSSWIT